MIKEQHRHQPMMKTCHITQSSFSVTWDSRYFVPKAALQGQLRRVIQVLRWQTILWNNP